MKRSILYKINVRIISVAFFLIILTSESSGQNEFYFNGAADVIFRYTPRGSGGRALVHDDGNLLTLNYGGDFSGGCKIGPNLKITNDGNLGIGTSNIIAPLSLGINHGVKIGIGNPSWKCTTLIETGWLSQYGDYTDLKVAGGNANNAIVRLIQNGSLLIGKTSQSNAAYKLDVEGSIRAHEIVINTSGADFVFDPTYKLRTLSELETFIRTNKHLPDIAPAKEMQQNGVSAGEMQTKLLQKVEELTLYMIEKDKEIADNRLKIDKQSLENADLRKMVLEMQREIEVLKSK